MTTRQSPKTAFVPSLALPPVVRAVLAQALAWLAVSALGDAAQLGNAEWTAWLLHGAIAALIGAVMGLSWWWLPINTIALPAAMLVRDIEIAPHWYLSAFAVCVLVYWSTFKTQVPLYLSGRTACAEISNLLPRGKQFRFLDVGCGLGTVLSFLAPRNLHGKFIGVEVAPLPYAIALLRGVLSHYHVARRSFWSVNFSDYDVVYAFLSPVPMSELWHKAKSEMRPGSMLISNTFAVDGIAPDETVRIGNGNRQLYIWRF